MLLPFQPHALVLTATLPAIDAEAFSMPLHEDANVLAPVEPRVKSLPVHIIIDPITIILAAIGPLIVAFSMNSVLLPVSYVD